jgi:hypothetical protein
MWGSGTYRLSPLCILILMIERDSKGDAKLENNRGIVGDGKKE